MGWPILNIVHEFENLQKLKKKKRKGQKFHVLGIHKQLGI
jgi:hypothetical protein